MRYMLLCLFMLGCNDAAVDVIFASSLGEMDVDATKDAWSLCDKAMIFGADTTTAQKEIAISTLHFPNYAEAVGRAADVAKDYAGKWKIYLSPLKYSNIFWIITYNLSKDNALAIRKGDRIKVTGRPFECRPTLNDTFILYFEPVTISVFGRATK